MKNYIVFSWDKGHGLEMVNINVRCLTAYNCHKYTLLWVLNNEELWWLNFASLIITQQI